jgi:Triose-phosphate Transporter family
MILYSFLFSMNIAMGNVSLQHVSINFNQMMRSLVPIIALYTSRWSQQYQYSQQQRHNNPQDVNHTTTTTTGTPFMSTTRQGTVYAVVVGVAISVMGDRMNVTILGFLYSLLCVTLAAIKVVASSALLTTGNLKLHPLGLLHRMAPWAMIQCLTLSILTGEFTIFRQQWTMDLDPISTGTIRPIMMVFISGLFAFSLNICALQAYRVTSPITCCIAASVKQVLMVVLGTYLFQTTITVLNGVGIGIVLIASTYYSYLSIAESNVTCTSDKTKHHNDDTDDVDDDRRVDRTLPLQYCDTTDTTSPNCDTNHHYLHPKDDTEQQNDTKYTNDTTIELGVPLLRPTLSSPVDIRR